ncbi:hypothetical protein DPEC_G00333010 [Dallia pectoralis]|uniref:Uncharacterized protein n=1 Tax=Dallia pectoralis TaxID=75939 RepID=A0ACC2F6E7_DALPE|nr:hypothetical protein DPEC_G00333010 [Dallia pectoralis]
MECNSYANKGRVKRPPRARSRAHSIGPHEEHADSGHLHATRTRPFVIDTGDERRRLQFQPLTPRAIHSPLLEIPPIYYPVLLVPRTKTTRRRAPCDGDIL